MPALLIEVLHGSENVASRTGNTPSCSLQDGVFPFHFLSQLDRNVLRLYIRRKKSGAHFKSSVPVSCC